MAEIRLSANLSVDAVEYASRANAILGIRDSGKTYTGTLIAEQLYAAGIPFFAFDPIGRWRFLKSPGKVPGAMGFPVVVAGGAAPDLPLTPDDAPKLIRAAMASGVSMIIDLYSIALSKKDWRSIVRQSIETILYEGDGHGQRHVFLEEAAEFIPQKPYDGLTYAAVEKLARMGGNVGVGITLINQRAEEVNKAVLELCDNLLLHRQRGKNSLLSLRKWLSAGNVNPPKEITDTLADLPSGQCYAWFKDVGKPRLIEVATKLSFDPDRRAMAIGRHGAAKGTPAGVDVTAFVARMKAALAGKPAEIVAGGHKPPKRPEPTAAPSGGSSAIKPKQEPQVDEKEARALREDNANLKATVADLRAKIAELERRPAPIEGAVVDAGRGEPPPTALVGADAFYAEFKRRLIEDGDPAVIRLLQTRPEIEVRVERKKIEMDMSNFRGRIAKLLADGFYDAGATNGATRAELRRTGKDMDNVSIGKFLAELVASGFLTRGEGKAYVAVPGMKVNIVEQ